ncbi:MAG TPA: hypothetical protein VNN73_14405 [Blastocatellia bacterium]|nr:hypothetical protein [Blastocatellia bacterium]
MTKSKPSQSSQKAQPRNWHARMMFQGWASLAAWMSFGLLLEGLLGYKIPGYLADPQRRELFTLAHTHGTLLGVVLVAAALCGQRGAAPARSAVIALQLGAILLPLGFLLAGIWHTEGDPGLAIWLVPPAALMVIFGAIFMALAYSKESMSSE